jgi:hypothetical protein
MGCILAVFALALPRVLMVLLFLVTDWFARAYDSLLWPILGFVFMPYTTLAYMAAMVRNNHQLEGGWMALFIIAIVVDASHWGGSERAYRRRSR